MSENDEARPLTRGNGEVAKFAGRAAIQMGAAAEGMEVEQADFSTKASKKAYAILNKKNTQKN